MSKDQQSMVPAEYVEWTTQLCCLHRPPLAHVAWYPPLGDPNGDHLDVLLETEDHATCIAVEITCCYRGDRASGEAKLEEQLLGRWETWLRDIAVECVGPKGYRVTFTIYQVVPLTDFVSGLKGFLKDAEDQARTRSVIRAGLSGG